MKKEYFDIKFGTETSPSLEGVDRTNVRDGVVGTKKLNLPYNRNLKERARELRKSGNLAEVLLWNKIKRKQLNGLDFDRQRIIGNYIVDFYCHQKLLIIEIDGSSHDGKVEYDKERENYLKSLGLKIIRFLDSDVRKNIESVLKSIGKI